MPKLVILNGACVDRVFELEDGEITVGRGPDNMIVIDDRTVSRTHAELLIYGPEVIVRDHGTANGTLVQGRPLNGGQCPRIGN